jgi:DNA-binding IclR family transcriptional regulator
VTRRHGDAETRHSSPFTCHLSHVPRHFSMSKNGHAEKNSSSLVPAVDRAVQILKLFHSSDELLGVSELSRRLELNKSTLHAILNTLAYHDMLERDEQTKTYRLGRGLFAMGSHVQGGMDLRAIAHPDLVELARQVQETVLLGVFRDELVLILDREEAPHDLKISAQLGQRMPFCAGVFGYVFGTAMPKAQLSKLVRERGLSAFTKNSVTKLPAYRRALAQVRERVYAIEREEFLEGVSAVAAPIVNAEGQVAAALCIVGLSARIPEARLADLGSKVMRVAKNISRRLGAVNYPSWNGVASVSIAGAKSTVPSFRPPLRPVAGTGALPSRGEGDEESGEAILPDGSGHEWTGRKARWWNCSTCPILERGNLS